MIKLKRVYESPSPKDGLRVLVERLWPRGLTKERAAVDLWLKDVAPSAELRKWFGHDPARWEQFQERYRQELREKKNAGLSLLCGSSISKPCCRWHTRCMLGCNAAQVENDGAESASL